MAELQEQLDALDGNVAPAAHAASHLPGGTDALTTAAANTITPDAAASAGSAASLARSDHQHAITCAAPGAVQNGDSAAEGSASSFARSDHRHSVDIKLDDLSTPDDNSDLNATTGRHGLLRKLSNVSTEYLNGQGNWISAPGIGQVWSADVPPTSAHASDDEMASGSVDAKWTEWDPGSAVTITMDTTRRMMKMVHVGTGTIQWGGVRQAVPASEFTAYTRVGILNNTGASGFAAGLFVSDNIASSPTTADFRTTDHGSSNAGFSINGRTWSAYNGSASATAVRTLLAVYMRVRVNGTSHTSEFSVDGVTWHFLSTVTLGFTPTHFGIAIGGIDNAVTTYAYFRFFRVFSGAGSSGVDATYIGGFV